LPIVNGYWLLSRQGSIDLWRSERVFWSYISFHVSILLIVLLEVGYMPESMLYMPVVSSFVVLSLVSRM
jgi:hypothetical protein